MNDTLKCLIERRSIRKYQKKQISEEQLQDILKAGEYAPTSMGKQSPVMVVVQEQSTIEKLSAMNAKVLGNEEGDPFYGAPTVVIVFADKSKSENYIQDGSLVMGNLMNAAYSLGVDSCWIHRAKEMFESEEGKTLLREWNISEDYVGIGNCILGYRDCELPKPAPRKKNYVYRV